MPFIQAVDPSPVDTMIPDEECDSWRSPIWMSYRAEVWVRGPMKRSLTARSVWPSDMAQLYLIVWQIATRYSIPRILSPRAIRPRVRHPRALAFVTMRKGEG